MTMNTVTDVDGDEIMTYGGSYEGEPMVSIYTSNVDGVALTADQIVELVINLGEALEEAEAEAEDDDTEEEAEPTIEVGDFVEVHGYTPAWEGAILRVVSLDYPYVKGHYISGGNGLAEWVIGHYSKGKGAGFYPHQLRLIAKAV